VRKNFRIILQEAAQRGLKIYGFWSCRLPLTPAPCFLYHLQNKFILRGGPEFHAEWLRDEP
jgi:hypothetical protein